MKKLPVLTVIVVFSVAAIIFLSQSQVPHVEYTSKWLETRGGNTDIHTVVYESGNAEIHSLLAIPQDSGRKPAFVLLPAQSITKEDEQVWAGDFLNSLGFVTLSLDQRGHGETEAKTQSLQDDILDFQIGIKTSNQMMVEDALNGLYLLMSRPEVDPSRVYIWGESMGGRFAILAAAQDPRARGVVLISTAGYGSGYDDPTTYDFFGAVDPDRNIHKISPRPIIMVHSTQDTIIPIASALDTFNNAVAPAEFIRLDAFFHGYLKENTTIEEKLEEKLKDW